MTVFCLEGGSFGPPFDMLVNPVLTSVEEGVRDSFLP